MTREEYKKIDYEKMGLLFGLYGNIYDLVKSKLESIDYDKVDDNALQFISPVIRRILSDINDKYGGKEVFGMPILLKMVDIDEIIDLLNNFIKYYYDNYNVLVGLNSYLLTTDIEAEFIAMFCTNYCNEFIQLTRTKEGLRHLKIKNWL